MTLQSALGAIQASVFFILFFCLCKKVWHSICHIWQEKNNSILDFYAPGFAMNDFFFFAKEERKILSWKTDGRGGGG